MLSNEHNIASEIYNLDFFFELSPDLMCVAGFDGFFKKVNPAFINTLGYTETELFSKPILEFIFEEDRALTRNKRKNLLHSTLLTQFENRYVHKNGSTVWLSWSSIALKEEQIVYAIAKDITAKKNIEIKRNQLLQNLNESNKDLKFFNYSSSHDLRSPLSNLMALHQLLETTKIDNPEAAEYIRLLKIATENLNEVINSYMNNWIKKDRLTLQLKEVDFETVLNEAKASIHQLILRDNVKFTTNFEKAPSVVFSPHYLTSVFLNLITNSIKYSKPNQTPEIQIHTEQMRGTVQLIYTDNGIGIDMDKAGDSIFKLHQRFHNTSQKDSNGIGLYLVYNHITSLGGTIEVTSTPNAGTTFIITFKKTTSH
ncbi:PAS domain-containing sensor histidine kinase [Leeuwenhoekiella sp. W20_SRS_FM14]|uniref:PAS domain-containing sensor histidine kinase n=1 Tax=Leeuwenhoekiella sp. W20_SRS_FM14 TaxID=3240270 RepID=UPI003F9DAAA8